MYNLMSQTSEILFGLSCKELAKQYDLPLLKNSNENERFGMFDIVQYYNNKITNESLNKQIETNDPNIMNVNYMNCVPHYDPGLLSLSILSTVEGLQLLDRKTDKWYVYFLVTVTIIRFFFIRIRTHICIFFYD